MIVSCESEEQKLEKIYYNFIAEKYPYNTSIIISNTTYLSWDEKERLYESTVSYSYSTQNGFKGNGKVHVRLNSDKEEVRLFSFSNGCPENIKLKNYNVYNYENFDAFGVEKVMATIVIPERYEKSDIEYISEAVALQFISGNKQWNISYYLKDMSIHGPNYALDKMYAGHGTFAHNISINVLTEQKAPTIDKSLVTKKNEKSPFSNNEIIGRFQFIGSSTMTIYNKNEKYYIVLYSTSSGFSTPDALVKVKGGSNPSFRYEDDTDEILTIKDDGLYCYYEGDLAAVYHRISNSSKN